MMFQIFLGEIFKIKSFINPKAIIKIAKKNYQTKQNLKIGIESFFQNQKNQELDNIGLN